MKLVGACRRGTPKMRRHRRQGSNNVWTHVVFQHWECKTQRRGAPASTANGDAGHHPQRKPAWWMRLALANPNRMELGPEKAHTERSTAAGLCSSCGWAAIERGRTSAEQRGGRGVSARVRCFPAAFIGRGGEQKGRRWSFTAAINGRRFLRAEFDVVE